MIRLIILVILIYLGFRAVRFIRRIVSDPLIRSKIRITKQQNQKPAWGDADIEDADFEDIKKNE